MKAAWHSLSCCHCSWARLWGVGDRQDRAERPRVGLWAVLLLLLHTYRFSCLSESKEEGTPLKLKCELCGRVDFAYKFKRSKRFCSMACAKR